MAIDMQDLLLRFGRVIAKRQFTRADGTDWIFRAPTLWFLGPRPRYRVDEMRKTRIETIYGATGLAGWLLFSITIVLFLWEVSLLLLLLWVVVLAVLENSVRCLALRPLLADAPRTS